MKEGFRLPKEKSQKTMQLLPRFKTMTFQFSPTKTQVYFKTKQKHNDESVSGSNGK